MPNEETILKRSLVAIVLVSGLGIVFGIGSGSFAILFDGVFSLVDAAMTVLSLFVARLITRSTVTNDLPEHIRRRFSMGFWHLEPMVLTLNATVLLGVTIYALFSAVMSLSSGGRTMEFGPAIAYAVVVFVVCAGMGWYEHRANSRIGSDFIKMDVQGWIMAGGITLSLLIAFSIGYMLDGSAYTWLLPYIDPAVLLLVGLLLVPIPIRILWRAVGEVLLITPDDLLQKVERVADEFMKEEGFSGHRAYAARVGRGTQIELYFIVPTGQSPRRLEEWDALRDRIGAAVGGDPRQRWLTIAFTTNPDRAG
ncbi:cation diffusion facilitator family transporter [Primorskyibacter marinus]|uniref:cation diffusion facilitator family transporter n=1 Tax=Primorskyibacter marinus TaxID=1977320 RepID=UPI000E301513|nr:cation transporter [Primorskyibacter marinus]